MHRGVGDVVDGALYNALPHIRLAHKKLAPFWHITIINELGTREESFEHGDVLDGPSVRSMQHHT